MMTNERLGALLTSIRRKIHRYPETGNREFRTTALLEKILKDAGIAVRRRTKTGLVALVKGGAAPSSKRCIAVRADIDALPIQERTNKPYASRRAGVMHACGHDANTAMAVGAALLLAEKRSEFSGAVKFLFQPNEESSGGAQQMIDTGALKDPDVDIIVGIHVNPWLAPGIVGLKPGAMMAAVDKFTIEVIGEGGHGAYPHLGRDTVVAASQIVLALQTIVSREIDPVEPAVITIGAIHGGEAFNVLANRVTMTGTVRTLDEKLHKAARKLIEKKVAALCSAYGVRYEFSYEVLGYPLRNSGEVLALCRKAAEKAAGGRSVKILEKPSMGGEDFAEYLRYVPGCFIFLGAARKEAYPWHNEKFDIEESALPQGAHLLEEIALEYLKK